MPDDLIGAIQDTKFTDALSERYLAYALSVHAAELVVVAAGFALFGHLGVGQMLSRNRDGVPAASTRHAPGRA